MAGGSRHLALAVSIGLCGRTAETLAQTADEIRALGMQAWPIVADISRLEDIQNFVSKAAGATGRVDILINNAVTSMSAQFDE